MAKLAPKSLILAVETSGEDYLKFMEREDAEFEKLYNAQTKIPKDVLVGRIVRFGMGDGYAQYLVTSEKPLTLQHISIGDRWSIPYAHIRGLRREDIAQQFSRSLFARRF